MLQIGHGKLFRTGTHHSTTLRGVVYSNLSIDRDVVVETAAGNLVGVDTIPHDLSLIFEFKESIEGDPAGQTFIISYGVNHYRQDFAALVSFFFRAICSPDVDLVRRLTNAEPGLAVRVAPCNLLKRVFDRNLMLTKDEAREFSAFVDKLIELPRATFLEVMRAIRTFVTGLHRIGDDLELAYTLMVASAESLAQAFDAHQAVWEDFEATKKRRIDTALDGVDPEIADRIKVAVLENEHVALRRRFKAFVQDHITPQFFRDHGGRLRPIGKQGLADGLDAAYVIRSSYIHRLQRLPDALIRERSYAETVTDGQRTLLSFEGLARVVRAVILEFVARQPRIEAEPHDYSTEHPSMGQARWAASVWMGNPAAVTHDNGRAWLEGLLELASQYALSPGSAQVPDLGASVDAVAQLLPSLRKEQLPPYLAAFLIFNSIVPREHRHPRFGEIRKQFKGRLSAASAESLLVCALTKEAPHLSLAEETEALDRHLGRRSHENGYRFPWLFDVAMSLDLAERYRVAGDMKAARQRLATTVETFPGLPELEALEASPDPLEVIDWEKMFVRAPDAKAEEAAGPAAAESVTAAVSAAAWNGAASTPRLPRWLQWLLRPWTR